MPLVDFSQQATWDSLYTSGATGLHYDRGAKADLLGNDGKMLVSALAGKGMAPGAHVVILGSAYGWIAEDFLAAGYGPIGSSTTPGLVVAVDTSPIVSANLSTQAVVPVLNVDLTTSAGRGAVQSALGLKGKTVADWLITEDVLTCLSDTECQALASACRLAATNVAHWVSVGVRVANNPAAWAGDSRLNWKTLADWKTLVSPDLVVQRGTSTVL